MSGTRDELIFMARLAEQAERYEDMIHYIKQVATMGHELKQDERNLLSVAYKNSVGARRQAWRAMAISEQRESPAANEWISNYKREVESELDATCNDIISILESHLIPQAETDEAKAFFMKMKGDYLRYSAEFKTDATGLKEAANKASQAYGEALQQAEGFLGAANPIRLGLALNYSVFFNEVMRNTAEAIKLARSTHDAAQPDLENLDEDQQRDSDQILQLLKDNLQLWTTSAAAAEGGKAPELDGTAVEDL